MFLFLHRRLFRIRFCSFIMTVLAVITETEIRCWNWFNTVSSEIKLWMMSAFMLQSVWSVRAKLFTVTDLMINWNLFLFSRISEIHHSRRLIWIELLICLHHSRIIRNVTVFSLLCAESSNMCCSYSTKMIQQLLTLLSYSLNILNVIFSQSKWELFWKLLMKLTANLPALQIKLLSISN